MATQLNPWVFLPGKSFKAHLFTMRTGLGEERYLTVVQPLSGSLALAKALPPYGSQSAPEYTGSRLSPSSLLYKLSPVLSPGLTLGLTDGYQLPFSFHTTSLLTRRRIDFFLMQSTLQPFLLKILPWLSCTQSNKIQTSTVVNLACVTWHLTQKCFSSSYAPSSSLTLSASKPLIMLFSVYKIHPTPPQSAALSTAFGVEVRGKSVQNIRKSMFKFPQMGIMV